MARQSAKQPALDASMPVVILHGKDEFQLRERARGFSDLLQGTHGEIEEFVFDGASCDLASVLDELRSYGLLQQHKLVTVDNADQFLAASTDGEASKKNKRRGALERYVAHPSETATLLLRATTWRPGKLDKLVAEHGGAIVKCEPPGAATAARWCVERARRRYEAELGPDAATALVDRVGAELMRLDQELAKLAAYAGAAPIDVALVRQLVGLSREEQAWEIQSSILSGRPDAALTKLRELLAVSGLSEVLVSWAILDLARKLFAAAEMTREGESGAEIAKRLRLWGDARGAVLERARRAGPEPFAALLQSAIEGDRRTKRGLAHPVRQLEVITLQLAQACAA